MTLSVLKIGLLAGILYFAHALIPGSRAWPLIWPLLGGAAAVFQAARHGRVESFGRGMAASAKAGSIAGALFFVATVAALSLLGTGRFQPIAAAMGAEGAIAMNATVVLSLAVAALIGMITALAAGALAYPMARTARS